MCPYARVPYFYCDECGKLIEDDLVESMYKHYHKDCYDELYGVCDDE